MRTRSLLGYSGAYREVPALSPDSSSLDSVRPSSDPPNSIGIPRSQLQEYGIASEELSWLRFLGIFLMIFLHLPNSEALWASSNAFLKHSSELWFEGLSRASSPLMGFLSAFFAFNHVSQRGLSTLLSARFKNLYVPAVLWSLLGALPLVVLPTEVLPRLVARLAAETSWEPLTYFNLSLRALGLSSWPLLNSPMHYLFDLLKCIVLFGVVHHLRPRGRRVFILLALVLFTASLVLGSGRFPHGANHRNFAPRLDLVLFFSLGYVSMAFGTFRVIVARIRSVTPEQFVGLSLILVLTSQYRLVLDIFDRIEGPLAFIVITFNRALSSVLVAKAVMMLAPYLKARVSGRLSFCIFACHMLVYSTVAPMCEHWLGVGSSPSLRALFTVWTACLLTTLLVAFVLRSLPRAAVDPFIPSR